LPLDEALRIARQIADALEEAHAKGVIHRDLKPGNIKVKPDGTVKVLDFGLAKIGGTPTVPSQDSPTIGIAATQAGVILGTAAYMSPEQARGKAVDKRTDIWAFGVVLYEMLTGEPLFEGEDLTDTLAAVVRKEPDWDRVPFEVRRLLKACLEKDPKRRLRDVGDGWRLLDEVPTAPAPVASASRSWLGIIVPAAATVFALIAAALAFIHFRETAAEPAAVRFEISAPTNTVLADVPPAVSPDSRWVAFVARGDDNQDRLWVRSIDSLDARVLPGTEGVRVPGAFWSPDSRSLGFFSGAVLKKIDVSGGPPVSLGDLGPSGGGTWNSDGVILVGSPRGVLRISQAGGPAELVTRAESPTETAHVFPHFLPDGRHFLYSVLYPTGATVYLASVDGRMRERLAEGARRAQYAPPVRRGEPGHLLYVRDGALLAQPLDSTSFELAGDAFPVAEQVGAVVGGAVALFSVSSRGGLAYRTEDGAGSFQLTWFDRAGNAVASIGPTGVYTDLDLSGRGDQVAVAFEDARSIGSDLFLLDAQQGVPSRFTSAPGVDDAPVWSPDDGRLAFSSDRGGIYGAVNGFVQDINGVAKEEQVLNSGRIRDWSLDGQYLLYDDRDGNGAFRLWVLPLGGDRKAILYPHARFNAAQGQFAPNPGIGAPGPPRWIAYTSNESGENEIYVQPFPPGRKIRISTGGGIEPRWRRDGKELFYLAPGGRVMAVEVTLEPEFERGPAKELFKAAIRGGGPRAFSFHYDVAPDGKKFLVIARAQQQAAAPSPITVVLNWQAALAK
jgi:Tol biopolymer transport system component